ncbi:N-acyl-D-amino-acid deacylase family protein [Sphingomonas solaris]|uniref:Amidohydrolase family protein n=1 Tax=Alterirhizorhabdus solaris TaxID=2529389 RepID=A0A558R7U1_9SPHN|nr:amidohydrolase family protein [Sphingomonas solaris]TVV75461.1 amidohydrolase family protein [Sphingomonas solaris]
MTARYDIIVRGGLVVDGTGAEPKHADIAIAGGIIRAVGTVDGTAAEEIDATGLLVTPGFIDLHTHYDGQAVWSQRMNPSSSHGVSTVILGNCGVGFAPCRPGDRELLCATMEGVEDIPGVVMKEGLTWDWETFPEYMDVIGARPRDIDIGVFAPHSPVRVNVMGERGANREVPTRADLAGMQAIVKEAVEIGALGFATSRTAVDRRSDGALIPSFDAGENELVAAAQAVKDAGGGLIQLIPELGMTGLTPAEEFALIKGVSDAVGLPITYTIVMSRKNPAFGQELLRLTQAHNRDGGAPIHAQYFPRPVGMMASFDLTSNPWVNTPAYKAIAHLPLAERVVELRKPEVRARILADEPDEALLPLTTMTRQYDVMFELPDPPCYEPARGTSIADRAAREGRPAAELAYDLLLENDGKGMLLVAFGNFANDSLDFMFDFFDDPHAVMGLGDGGAHYGLICDSSYPTFVLTHWTRDRQGRRLAIEEAVRLMTSHPAAIVGFRDRGVIAPGYKADVNVIDYDGLTLHAPEIADDLPGGGRRLDQRANGYRYMIVAGEIITRDDRPTGALPGKLVRGAQAAPAPALAA